MKNYEVKLGRGAERWQSPYDYIVPEPEDRGLCGSSLSIGEALDRPIASPPLEELAAAAEKIVICIPDITRGWCRAADMNAAVRARIASATKKPVTWVIATGQHRAAEEWEKDHLFGADALAPGDSWHSHDCTKAVPLGVSTPSGTPVSLDADVAAADLVVLVGGVIYHDMAGFSGGRKTIIPGVSGRASVVVNHNHCLIDGRLNPATDTGLLEHNPMAQDQRAYTDLALRGKKCFILNAVGNSAGEPAAWVAGDIWKAWDAGCAACRSFNTIYIPHKAARCVTCCGGFPFDMDLYQATKALFSPLSAMQPKAPIVLVAGLEDALGPGDFGDCAWKALRDPAGFAEKMKTAFTIPGYIALRMVLEMEGRPCALVTPRGGVPFPGKVFRTMGEADRWLQDVSGLDGLSILVPSGNSIHVAVRG